MNDFIATINGICKNIVFNCSNKYLIDGKKFYPELKYTGKNYVNCTLNNVNYNFLIEKIDGENYGFQINGQNFEVTIRSKLKESIYQENTKKRGLEHQKIIKAPMPGLLVKINKNIGERIEVGESIAILEAMKMENEIKSPVAGKILKIFAEEGYNLEKNSKIIMVGL